MFRGNARHTARSRCNGPTRTPAVLWEFVWPIDGTKSSAAVAPDGTVYVGSFDGKVRAFNGATGAKRWEFAAGWTLSSPAIGADGTVYIGTQAVSKVFAFDGATGAKVWEFDTGDNLLASPSIGPGRVIYIGSFATGFYAIR